MALSTGQRAEIKALLASGQKIEAIKRFRELTGLGLAESMNAVTQMALSQAEAPASKTHAPLASTRPPTELNPKARQQAESEAMTALRAGNVIEAIQKYQRHTRVGLKEAKDAVDALNVVHQSEGRVNTKLAATLVGLVRQGKTQEAVTHLMSNVGYEEPDARALLKKLKTLGAGRPGCGCGCLNSSVGLAFTLVAAIVLGQAGCNLVVRNTRLYECLTPLIAQSPALAKRLGPGVKLPDYMFVREFSVGETGSEFSGYMPVSGPSGSVGLWISAALSQADGRADVTFGDKNGADVTVFSGAFKCSP